MSIDISAIWFVITVFATLIYVVMDGSNLGTGMPLSVVHDSEERDMMINSVAPARDGNETWLALGGVGLFGVPPPAYVAIIDALVIPLTAMLIGLASRGVTLESHFKAVPLHRTFWDYAFAGGSLLVTSSQGIVIGAFINGFTVVDRRFAGSTLNRFTPFNLFCGLGLVVTYLLLGTTWLIMKSEDTLQQRMHELTYKVPLAPMVVTAVVSVRTLLGWYYVVKRWFAPPSFFWLLPVPILVLALSLWVWRLNAHPVSRACPSILTLSLTFFGFSGLGVSVWPNIIPSNISPWDVVTPPSSQVFMLLGALLIIPVVLMYTAWSYYVFHGRVSGSEGYH